MRRRLLVVLLCLSAVGVSAPAAGADSDQIILESTAGIQLLSRDGDVNRVIGPTGLAPAVSADGEWLAYLVQRTEERQLWVSRTDGTDARPLMAPAAGTPTWSAAGDALAVESEGRIVLVTPADGAMVAISAPPQGARDSAPVWSAVTEEIAFVRRYDGGRKELLLTSREGQERVLLNRQVGTQVIWSPGGREIFFADGDVFVVDVATAAVRTVATPSRLDLTATTPAVSPDGARLAYGANPLGAETGDEQQWGGSVFVVDAAATTNGAGEDLGGFGDSLEATTAWSPDGTAVVVGTSSIEDSGNIWFYGIAPADGSGEFQRLPTGAAAYDFDRPLVPVFLAAPIELPPDRRVAFSAVTFEGDQRVLAVSLGTARLQEVTAGVADAVASWSPDGRRLAYIRGDPEQGTGEIRVLDMASGTDVAVTPSLPTVSRATWSPDGTQLAFDSDADLWLAAVDGSGVRRLTQTADVLEYDPHWSPTSTQLVFTRSVSLGPGSSGRDEVVVLDLETEEQVALAEGVGHDWSTAGIAYAATDGGVGVVDPLTGRRRHRDEAVAERVRWSPDRLRLLAGGPEGVRVIDVLSGQVTVVSPYSTSRVAWASDGGAVAYGDDRDNINLQRLDLEFPSAGAGRAVGWDFAPEPGPQRLGGTTRLETALAISRSTFSSAATVVLARADLYADALAGAPLAAAESGPVLLTPSDHLPDVLWDEIGRLNPQRVVLLGDESAIGPEVEDAIGEMDIPVRRLAGANRHGTAAAVARELGAAREVYVAEGGNADPARGWPDAVSAAAAAASAHAPLLLVERNRLPEETLAALDDVGAERIVIVGGVAAVSEEVEQQLAATGRTVERIAGTDRYDTSARVATRIPSRESLWLATGTNWPDSLTAAAAAAAVGGPVLLVPGGDLDDSPAAREWLEEQDIAAPRIRIAGSRDAVSEHTVAGAELALSSRP